MQRTCLLSALPLLLTSAAAAQNLDVAIVAAASTLTTDCRYTDPQAMLMATGMFSSVSVINAGATTPTLQDLSAFDAILTWSNVAYSNGVAMGNVLADYVDNGGGVVVAVFALGAGGTTLFLQGRWQTTYELIAVQVGQTAGAATLGTVHAPGHPIMAGVTSFSGGTSSYRPTTTTLTMGSTSIADWSDGRVLVATGTMPNRVDLAFYPPSSLCRTDFWDSTTDGDLLMANALVYAAQGGALGTRYCSPAVANSTGGSGVMSATGSATVANNNLVLVASDLPLNAFGFFLTSRAQGNVQQPGGSQGVLCLSGSIGRYVGPGQVMSSGAAGEIALPVDLNQHPTPTGLVAVAAGETWNFQGWYRDAVGGVATSNFTDGLELSFQ